MKKFISIVIVFVMLVSMNAISVFADTTDTCTDTECVHLHTENENSTYAVNYPPCPRDSTHRGRSFQNLGAQGHLVYCRVCSATIMQLDGHIWSVDEPNCTMGVYCIVCNYKDLSKQALGHDVYPAADNEYVAINHEIHAHVCHREGCVYNPNNYEYQYYLGYLEDEPMGNHQYYTAAYFESYRATDGTWRHKKYQDCYFCNYRKYYGWFICNNNNSNCTGGCDTGVYN